MTTDAKMGTIPPSRAALLAARAKRNALRVKTEPVVEVMKRKPTRRVKETAPRGKVRARSVMKSMKRQTRVRSGPTVMSRIKIETSGQAAAEDDRKGARRVKEELDAKDGLKKVRRVIVKREKGEGKRIKLVMMMKGKRKKNPRPVDDEDSDDDGDERKKRPYVVCNVLNCTKAAHWRREIADQFADGGMRCRRHHLYCEVPKCTNVNHVVKTSSDIFGPPGRRCRGHAHSCNIEGCQNVAGAKKMQKDSLGPAGWRCPRHAYFCSFPDCKNVGQVIKYSNRRRSAYHDANPTTRLCMRHAHSCNIPGCTNVVKRKKKVADCFGPVGWRCERHNHPCSVEGCTLGGRVKKQSDHFGPAGWRCKRHGHKCQVLETIDENEVEDGKAPQDMTKMRQCKNVAHKLKKNPDRYGPAGWRCQKHSYPCNVPNCPNVPLVIKEVADSFGEAGWRCKQHGHICNVAGCTHMAHVCETDSDAFGPRGKRCKRHSMRYVCGVYECTRLARVIVRRDDILAKAGNRCGEHSHACTVAGCKNPGLYSGSPDDDGKRRNKRNEDAVVQHGLPLEAEDPGTWYCGVHDVLGKKSRGSSRKGRTVKEEVDGDAGYVTYLASKKRSRKISHAVARVRSKEEPDVDTSAPKRRSSKGAAARSMSKRISAAGKHTNATSVRKQMAKRKISLAKSKAARRKTNRDSDTTKRVRKVTTASRRRKERKALKSVRKVVSKRSRKVPREKATQKRRAVNGVS